jgi:hypothetical protein
MTSLAIACLSSRVAAPSAEALVAVAPLLEHATRCLPQSLDALLPRVLAAAGLPPEAVVSLRRLDVRLRLDEDADAESVARCWAEAIAAALTQSLPRADHAATTAAGIAGRFPHADHGQRGAADSAMPDRVHALSGEIATRDDADRVAFIDLWQAEAAWLRRHVAGLPAPWWENVLGTPPSGAHAVIAGWIERDPARAAVALLDLLLTAPGLSARLSPREASWLAVALARRLSAALPAGPGGGAQPGEPVPIDALPRSLRRALAEIAPERRLPFLLAAVLTYLPAWTPGVANAEAQSAALDLRSDDPVESRNDTRSRPDAAGTETNIGETALAATGVAVLQGGLLLLLRPLALSGLLDDLHGNALVAALQALGLAALRRTTMTLSPTARRLLLERDRPLLTVFAGQPPPEAPLDTQIVPPDAEQRLQAILALSPPGVDWAPGALRAAHGGSDPFGDTADGLLARILLRPGRLVCTRWSADLTWPLASADIALRCSGWDIDPGWLPWLGRTVRFHYDGPDLP